MGRRPANYTVDTLGMQISKSYGPLAQCSNKLVMHSSMVRGVCRNWLLRQQVVAQGLVCRLGTIGRASLGKDVTDVGSDSVEADAESIGNVSVALPSGHEV